VRHGQYDETYKEDGKRILTALGRAQAEKTGERLAELLSEATGPVRLHSSTMTRAIETADIISTKLTHLNVPRVEANPDLSEGYPAVVVPRRSKDGPGSISPKLLENSQRIENGYNTIFHRATAPVDEDGERVGSSHEHEYDIVVCHGNVIRYMALRALQLPPEAWLRLTTFNCSLTYLVVRPGGRVSLRTLGDTGHLPMALTTFSMHYGYEW